MPKIRVFFIPHLWFWLKHCQFTNVRIILEVSSLPLFNKLIFFCGIRVPHMTAVYNDEDQSLAVFSI